MKRHVLRITVGLVLASWVLLASGCTITPGLGIGVDFDYYGGKFHARPTVNIGITGHP